MACTDLLSPEGILRATRNTMTLAATCPEDRPLAMQLYGSAADRLCDAARWAEDRGADVVDLNMGCPVDKVTKKDGGSKLLCDPDNTLRMVEKLAGCLKRAPLTCKMRLGWDDGSIVAPYLAPRLEGVGVKLIVVHGRTTEMKFTGQVRIEGIGEVVASVKHIPVIGNGDIKTPEDAREMIRRTGCAGVMIGRGALARPWLARDVWRELNGMEPMPEPTLETKCQLIRDHFLNLVRFRDERNAVMEMRRRISWYAKAMQPCKRLREEVREIGSYADLDGALRRFLDWREERTSRGMVGEPEPEIEVESGTGAGV
jgi:nifR3 family TIM-barrel protein